jgi:hypothetical protein
MKFLMKIGNIESKSYSIHGKRNINARQGTSGINNTPAFLSNGQKSILQKKFIFRAN